MLLLKNMIFESQAAQVKVVDVDGEVDIKISRARDDNVQEILELESFYHNKSHLHRNTISSPTKQRSRRQSKVAVLVFTPFPTSQVLYSSGSRDLQNLTRSHGTYFSSLSDCRPVGRPHSPASHDLCHPHAVSG